LDSGFALMSVGAIGDALKKLSYQQGTPLVTVKSLWAIDVIT